MTDHRRPPPLPPQGLPHGQPHGYSHGRSQGHSPGMRPAPPAAGVQPAGPQPGAPQRFPPRPLPPGAMPPRRVDGGGRRGGYDDGGRSWAGTAGLALLGVLVLAAAGLGLLAWNPPVELIKSQLVAEVKARTGRDLVIAGPAKFSILPVPGVTVADVSLSAAPGMTAPPLIKMTALEIRLAPWPLLSRRVEVERLVLRNPAIALVTDASGRRSWDMTRTADMAPRRVELAEASLPNRASDAAPSLAGAEPGRPASSTLSLAGLSLENVKIVNGTVAWTDARSGTHETLTAVNLVAEMRELSRPLEVTGTAALKGEAIELTSSLATATDLLGGRPAKLAVSLKSSHGTLGFDGRVDPAGGGTAGGALTLKASSVRNLARLAGVELAEGSGGSGSLAGTLAVGGGRAALDRATLTVDGASAAGSLAIQARGARPLLTADLTITALDVDRYLGDRAPGRGAPRALDATPPAPASAPVAAPAPAPSAAPPPAAQPKSATAPRSIDDLLEAPAAAPGPRVKGFSQRAGWSTDPFPTAALGALDADVKLQLARVVYRQVRLSQARIAATLEDRVLTARIEDLQAYEGRGRGVVRLEGSAMPRLSASLAADGVAMGPLVRDATQTNWLSGTGRLTLTLDGQGTSQQALMESLAGKADVTLNNGAVAGWNVAQIIRGLRQGQITGLERTETAKTDFSEIVSSWTISGGVAQNQDLRMTSPLLRVTGAGRVDLGARDLDYLLRPKVVASLDGQGGAQALAGLEVPLKLRGPWERIEVTPDVGGLLKDPDKAVGALKDIGKQLKGKNPDEIVDHVLGDNPKAAKKAKDLLGKFLKPKPEPEPGAAPRPAPQ